MKSKLFDLHFITSLADCALKNLHLFVCGISLYNYSLFIFSNRNQIFFMFLMITFVFVCKGCLEKRASMHLIIDKEKNRKKAKIKIAANVNLASSQKHISNNRQTMHTEMNLEKKPLNHSKNRNYRNISQMKHTKTIFDISISTKKNI